MPTRPRARRVSRLVHRPITTNVPHTLLLADDSVTIQRVIELTFADEDIQVVAVSDGDQAIARLDTTPPDIVLADVGHARQERLRGGAVHQADARGSRTFRSCC